MGQILWSVIHPMLIRLHHQKNYLNIATSIRIVIVLILILMVNNNCKQITRLCFKIFHQQQHWRIIITTSIGRPPPMGGWQWINGTYVQPKSFPFKEKMVITYIRHFNKRIEIKLMEIKSKLEHILSLHFMETGVSEVSYPTFAPFSLFCCSL